MKNGRINLIDTAFRNIFRHKIKTILTVLAIVIGVTLYIVMDALLIGLKIDSERNIINYETGSVKIYSKAYFDKKDEMPMYETFYDYQDIIETLSDKGYSSTPRILFGGSLISKNEEMPFAFYGINTDLERDVFRYDNYIMEGKFPEKDKFDILLGYKGAERLMVKTGDMVRLSTVIDKKDENGFVRHINQIIDLNVCGIISTPNPKNNSQIGYISLDILQDEMGLMLEGGVTEICIRKKGVNDALLPDKTESPSVIKNILQDKIKSGLIVVGWEEDVGDFLALSRSKSGSSKLMIFVLFLLAYIGMANTMLMAVIERTKEIGLMRSMGLTDFQIVRLFFYEAGFVGFIGSVIGVLSGVVINLYMVNVGLDFTKMLSVFGDNYGYRVNGEFKSAWNIQLLWIIFIVTPLLSGVTALMPVFRALKKQISESLRFE